MMCGRRAGRGAQVASRAMSQGPVLVGIDRSDESAVALATALVLAAQLGRAVTVVHAVGLLEEGGYRTAPPIDEIVAGARGAAGIGDGVTIDVVRQDGPAADVLARVADEVGAGMIVVGRRGLGRAPRPLGSVSEALLGRSDVPVLVVPHAG